MLGRLALSLWENDDTIFVRVGSEDSRGMLGKLVSMLLGQFEEDKFSSRACTSFGASPWLGLNRSWKRETSEVPLAPGTVGAVPSSSPRP